MVGGAAEGVGVDLQELEILKDDLSVGSVWGWHVDVNEPEERVRTKK